MDAIEFFENNKDSIFKTAEFLCKDGANDVYDKFNELKSQYYNKDGTKHNEILKLGDINYPISRWLDLIRNESVEIFMIIGLSNNKTDIVYQTKGSQFRSVFDLDSINTQIMNYLIKSVKCDVKEIRFYVLHNHPFMYKALPSAADLMTIEPLFREITIVEKQLKQLGIYCNLNLGDFAIVTAFDYWSMMQSE